MQITANLSRLFSRPRTAEEPPKFGTFDGVFLPTLLTILGAVMYLRTGWVMGNAGLVGGILVILLANLITICTGLSISSIATNIRVREGGSFSIISQSLGLEVGASVSVPFYLAQAVSVSFYIFAFSEGWLRLFPTHSATLVVFIGFAACFVIALVSVNLAARVRYPILIIIVLSLISIGLGSFPALGGVGFVADPPLWGRFPSGDFWAIFAVFFPAVTGVLTGVNMSGVLKNPRKSIPIGMMSAVILTMLIYLALAYWVSRVATPEELVTNFTIMVDRALYGPAVLLGILAATFSAALNSMVSAPRVLQAIAEYDVFPGINIFARQTSDGEPRPAMYLTGVIGLVTLIFGLLTANGLNAIAPLMTMFFLITYAVLNGVMMIEQLTGLVSFRPLLRVPLFVPVIGLVGCIFSMFLIHAIFSLFAVLVTLVLYVYLSHRDLRAPWSDVRSGLFVTLAEWAAKQVDKLPTAQERAWRPSLLAPVQSTQSVLGSYRFVKAITYPRGSVHILGLYQNRDKSALAGLNAMARNFAADGIFSRVALLEVDNPLQGVRTGLELLHSVFFHPNIVFLPVVEEMNEATLQYILDHAIENEMGAILFARHTIASLGREKCVNVWIREQSPDWEVGLRLSNLDLNLLLAYQLVRNWQGQMTLITLVSEETERANGQTFLSNLVEYGRMPRQTRTVVEVSSLDEFLPRAPQADLHIFGLQKRVDVKFMARMVSATNASCIFVRSSGQESALA